MSQRCRRLPAVLVPLLCWSALCPGLPFADPPLPSNPQEERSAPQEAAASQDVTMGSTVRLRTTLPEGTARGTVKSIDENRITVVDRKNQETSVPWSAIERFEVQVGVRHRYGTAALIGGGILAFVLLVAPNTEPCFAPGCPEDEMYDKRQAALIGGAVGALCGLWAEGVSKPTAPRWQTVRPPYPAPTGTSVGLGVAPARDGLGVRWVLTF